MPAIRGKQKKAPKSTKAKSYTKASAAAKSKSPSDASKPSPTENGTYDRIQMFTDVIRVSSPASIILTPGIKTRLAHARNRSEQDREP